MITIAADENIPHVRDAFADLGHVRLTPGRALTAAAVKDADVLLVRSVTRVDESLLGGSQVKMVATATIGTDHVDQAYLSQAGIAFAGAAGSNANSVGEYIVAALLTLAERERIRLAGKVIGVIGVGHVGGNVVSKCQALGMTVLKNDPPLKEQTGSDEYIELPDLLAASDVVTLHVPLTVSGRWPTRHMVNDAFLHALRPGCWMLNASRGAVIDESALKKSAGSRRIRTALDVWGNEPRIDTDLLTQVDLGTAHIAGYSFDGKINGTQMIYEAVCKFLGRTPSWQGRWIMPVPPTPVLTIDPTDTDEQHTLHQTVTRIYDIEADDRRLREILTSTPETRSRHFDQLRKHYPIRREFFNTALEFTTPPAPSLISKLHGLGFKTSRSLNPAP